MLSGHTKTTINFGKGGKEMFCTFEMNFFCKFTLVSIYFVDGCRWRTQEEATVQVYKFHNVSTIRLSGHHQVRAHIVVKVIYFDKTTF